MLLPGRREDRWAQRGENNLGGIRIIGIFERRSKQEWILNVKVYYMMTFFLVTTDHLETRLWFRDDEDFKSGMNLVAVTAYSVGVRVLSFILMSNHVHFVLEGDEEKVLQFITEFKRAYSRYLSHKYGSRDTLRRNGTDVQGLPLDGESLERAIAYVQMNSVAANICTRPEAYPWGTGNTFFQVVAGKGRPLGELSARARYRTMHSKANLPDNWIVGEDGYVLPESYVTVRFVESLFRSPKRMNYFLQNSSKAKRALSRLDMNLPSFRDQTLLAVLPDLCQSLFRERDIHLMNREQQAVLVEEIRRRFSADVNQIARIIGISYSEIASMMQEF